MLPFDRAAQLLGQYIERAFSRPERRFLFLQDPRGLIPQALTRLEVWGQQRPVLHFQDPLTLRDALEDLRDLPAAPEELPLALVVFGSTELPLAVADLKARAEMGRLRPTGLLEATAPQYEWHPELDFLLGEDLWRILPALLERRAHWEGPLTPVNVPLFVAEAFLGRSLRGKLSTNEALHLWERIEQDEETAAFLGRYPDVSRAVQRAVQAAMPIEVKLERDPDFAVFLWTMYFLSQYAPEPELLLPQLFDADTWEKYAIHDYATVRRTCEALLEQDPTDVIGQVRTAERALTEDPRRERLFLSLLGLTGPDRFERALRIACNERISGYLTEQALQVLIPEIIARPRVLSKTRLRQLERVLLRQHLGARYPSYFTRMHETVELFQSVIALSGLVEQYHTGGYDRKAQTLPIEHWTQELYPNLYVPMALHWERLTARLRNSRELLSDRAADLLDEAARILARMNLAFAQTVQRHYVRWVRQQTPPPHLTVDFLETVFLPHWREQLSAFQNPMAVVCLLHGLRWDEWVLLEPLLDRLLKKHRRTQVRPLLSLLPSTRVYNTAALILGRFPALSDSGTMGSLFSERLAMEGISFAGTISSPHLRLPERQSGVFLANLYLPGLGIHKSRRTGEVGQEAAEEALAQIAAFLESIPPRAGIFFVSNGGVTEVHSAPIAPPTGCVELQRRWLGLASLQADPALAGRVAAMNAAAIHLPNPQVAQCLFALPNVWFSTQERTGVRFYGGGISLEEMILPCAVYLPRRPSRRTTSTQND